MRNGDRRHGVISCCTSSPFPQLLPLTLARQKALNSPYLAFPFTPPWNQIGKKRKRSEEGAELGRVDIMEGPESCSPSSIAYATIHPTSSCSWWFSRPPIHCFCDPSTWPPVQMTLSQSSPEPRSGRQCGHAGPTEARQRVRSRAIDSEVPWHWGPWIPILSAHGWLLGGAFWTALGTSETPTLISLLLQWLVCCLDPRLPMWYQEKSHRLYPCQVMQRTLGVLWGRAASVWVKFCFWPLMCLHHERRLCVCSMSFWPDLVLLLTYPDLILPWS